MDKTAVVTAAIAAITAIIGYVIGTLKDPVQSIMKSRRLERFIFQMDRDLRELVSDPGPNPTFGDLKHRCSVSSSASEVAFAIRKEIREGTDSEYVLLFERLAPIIHHFRDVAEPYVSANKSLPLELALNAPIDVAYFNLIGQVKNRYDRLPQFEWRRQWYFGKRWVPKKG